MLTVSLHLTSLYADLGGLQFSTRAFGTAEHPPSIPGPTLVVRPGDVINITLINDLTTAPQNQTAAPGKSVTVDCSDPKTNCVTDGAYSHPNSTNLHTHGLHVSPLQPGDNVLDVVVPPGGTYNYSYRIPRDHTPGLFWYHPHLHRSVAIQTAGGAAGAIVVSDPDNAEDDEDDADLIVLQTIPSAALRGLSDYSGGKLWHLFNSTIPTDDPNKPENNQLPEAGPFDARLADNIPLVNGHLTPTMHIPTKSWRRWRILHAGAFFFMDLSIEPAGAVDTPSEGCEIHLLSTDGIPLPDGPRKVSRVILAPAGRAEVAVRCSSPGKMRLASGARPGASGKWNGDMYWAPSMMNIVVTEDKMCGNSTLSERMPMPRRIRGERPAYLRDLRGVPNGEIAGRFSLSYKDAKVVHDTAGGALRYPRNGDAGGTCTFNGKVYNRSQPLTTMRIGTVQEWNVSGVQGHPFHAHVNPYQVVAFGMAAQPHHGKCDAEYGAVCLGDWHDTLQLPNPDNDTSALLRFVTDSFHGEQVVHCHYLNHEDLGCIGFARIAE